MRSCSRVAARAHYVPPEHPDPFDCDPRLQDTFQRSFPSIQVLGLRGSKLDEDGLSQRHRLSNQHRKFAQVVPPNFGRISIKDRVPVRR